MASLGNAWIETSVASARDRLEAIDQQLQQIEAGLAELERVQLDGPEREALKARSGVRRRDRDKVDTRRAILQRLAGLSRTRQPEPVRRWRVGCVARLDRAPVALAEMKDAQWRVKGPHALVQSVTDYLDSLQDVGRRAEVELARTNARKVLYESADDTLEAASAKRKLRESRESLVPLILEGLRAEMRLSDEIIEVRADLLAPLDLQPPGLADDDVAWVPSRLYVRLANAAEKITSEDIREARQLRASWPAWLRRLHDAGSPEVDATMELYALRPADV
jgi:hypothetical protein